MSHLKHIFTSIVLLLTTAVGVTSCIEPPLKLPAEEVMVEMPTVIADLDVVWNVDVDWRNGWYYGWDDTDISIWGDLEYPHPTSFEVRRYFLGNQTRVPHTSVDAFTIYSSRFRRTYEFGYYDMLIWSNIDSKDHTQVVKVIENDLDVKDYTFTLNTYKVLNGTSVTVTASAAPTNGVYTVSTGCTMSGNVVTVPNNTAEGDYTVTLTVNGGTDEEVVYTKTFNVQNQYSVALSKNTLKTTVGAPNGAEYGTDFIIVTSTKNQVADAVSAELAGKYTIEGLAADTYKFFVDGTDIKLQVKTSVAAGTYTVVYTGQTGKTATAQFVIQK